MTKQEFGKFVMALKTYYPREQLLPNQQAIELWYLELRDIPMEVAEASLRKWVATNKWPPTIAEIRETAACVANGDIPDWSEGWEKACAAIRRYGYYNSGQAMASLDPLTRETVRRIGFYNLCMSENHAADRANFRQTYEILAKREQMNKQLPRALQETIGRIQCSGTLHLSIGGGTDGEEKGGTHQ